MNRCLHITIHESSAAAPRHDDWTNAHPEDGYPLPKPTDPEDDYPMPKPPDPPKTVPPPPTSTASDSGADSLVTYPSTSTTASATPRAAPGVVATACSCCCAPAYRDTAAPAPFIGPRDYSGVVVVRMAPGIESVTAQTLWNLAEEHRPKLKGLQAVLELPARAHANGRITESETAQPPEGTLASRALVNLQGRSPEESPQVLRRRTLNQIHELEGKTANTAFPPLHSLASYWRLDLREHPDLVEEVVARLNSLPEVGLAYREIAATDPQEAAFGRVLSEDQGYLDDAPMGISAAWALKCLAPTSLKTPATAEPLTVCDLEQGWDLDHQDLKDQIAGPCAGSNRAQHNGHPGHHGTAVLGQLAAAGKGTFGVKGAAAGLSRFVLASHYDRKDGSNGHVASAILQALSSTEEQSLSQVIPLKPGDVLLIEVQRGKLPTEVDEADFNAIRLAAGLGIVVIEAAGNGGFDLDAYSDPDTGRSLRRGGPGFRDSGAVLVGAARADLPHDRAPFSNYGSRVDCFGWGEAVTTCGYGDLAGTGVTNFYTNSFSGTSSASPIIAGAAAVLQSLHQIRAGTRLEPWALRKILANPVTGTRQGPNVPGNIGVMPDLKAIVRDRLQLVPDVYLRRSVGDDGAPPAPGDEISSSPDLFISSQGSRTVRSLFGAGSPGENLAAPGESDGPGPIYLRLRNRGIGEGSVHAQLFASPAATLITPERWIPVGRQAGLDIGSIPQGDTLFVAGPVPWKLPVSGKVSTPFWSLLAILSEPGESQVPGLSYFDVMSRMPPGPPYFDWAEYRAFLRGPDVAWRNVHRATAASPALPFFIAGTPDRARRFDFEVIQRLPAGAKVSLTVPPALAAKLRQNLPWIDDGTRALSLPKRPRTVLSGVELAAGLYAEARFTVTVQPGAPLETGHSLALRQLWHGEEVGRITWFFGLDNQP